MPARPPQLQQALGHDGAGCHQQRHPQDELEPVLHLLAVPELLEDEDPSEGRRDGAGGQASHQGPVHGAAAHVHPAPDRLHHHRRHEVTGHGGQGLDLEQENEDGGHQCSAAHPRHADGESDDQSCQGDVRVDVHCFRSSRCRVKASSGSLTPLRE